MGFWDTLKSATMMPLSALAGRPPGLPEWASKPRLPAWATPPGLPASMTPPGMVPRGGDPALVGGGGGQLPGSALGGGAGTAHVLGVPLSTLASGMLGVWGAKRRYGAPGMPGGWGGGYGGYGGYGGQPGAASGFTSDPALNPGGADAAAYNAQIDAANPGGADPTLPYYQGTSPGGGFLAGVGETLAPGRSVTQADADRFVSEARGLGASDEWMRDFLQRNPNDYSRLTSAWHDEFTGDMGDSNDPAQAGQLVTGGTPPGAPPVAAPGYQPGVGAPGVPYGDDMYSNPDFGPGGAGPWAPGTVPATPGLPPWLYGGGGGYRPQVQDPWGRSPGNPNYGRPPQPGETGLGTPPPAPTHDIYGTPLTPGGPASAPPGPNGLGGFGQRLYPNGTGGWTTYDGTPFTPPAGQNGLGGFGQRVDWQRTPDGLAGLALRQMPSWAQPSVQAQAQTPHGAGGLMSISDMLAQLSQGRRPPYAPPAPPSF